MCGIDHGNAWWCILSLTHGFLRINERLETCLSITLDQCSFNLEQDHHFTEKDTFSAAPPVSSLPASKLWPVLSMETLRFEHQQPRERIISHQKEGGEPLLELCALHHMEKQHCAVAEEVRRISSNVHSCRHVKKELKRSENRKECVW